MIDDLWKELARDTIKLAFQDGHPGSKIIITTRNKNVAEYVCGACSLGGILEEFGWFGGMLEEFVREKHCSG